MIKTLSSNAIKIYIFPDVNSSSVRAYMEATFMFRLTPVLRCLPRVLSSRALFYQQEFEETVLFLIIKFWVISMNCSKEDGENWLSMCTEHSARHIISENPMEPP